MCNKLTVLYAIRAEDTSYIPELAQIVDHLPIIANSISAMFTLLADPTQCVDGIVIDIDSIFNESRTTLTDIIVAMNTLVACKDTGYNDSRGKPLLAAAVTTTSSTTLINEVLASEIGSIFPAGVGFSMNERVSAMLALLGRKIHIPKQVMCRLNTKPARRMDITLTGRETQVLNIIRERGVSNKVVASMLGISESTVKVYVSAIFRKYGVRNRTQLALFSN